MATRGGARCLGRDDIGSLEPGKAADLILIDTRRLSYAGAGSDPLAALVFSPWPEPVDTVMVNGRDRRGGRRLRGRGRAGAGGARGRHRGGAAAPRLAGDRPRLLPPTRLERDECAPMLARGIRSYHRPTRLEEALDLAAQGVVPLAGGTRLLARDAERPQRARPLRRSASPGSRSRTATSCSAPWSRCRT